MPVAEAPQNVLATPRYSKLTKIIIYNFMSIAEAEIEVDETGIINLAGYNDSGKSAVLRTIRVLFFDDFSKDQAKFIRRGCDYFGVGVEFDDGVAINKYKYKNGKSEWEMKKGDTTLFTNRLADGLAAMPTVPEPIVNYLGVVEDETTGEKLNVRSNTDRMFLIHTTGSDNYKILNAVLRADTLSKTVDKLNTESNKIQADLSHLTSSSFTMHQEITSIDTLDEEQLKGLSETVENLTTMKHRYQSISSIYNLHEEIKGTPIPPTLEVIDTAKFAHLKELNNLKEQLKQPIPPTLEPINTEKVVHLKALMRLQEELKVPTPPTLKSIDTSRLRELESIRANHQIIQKADLHPTLIPVDTQKLRDLQNLRNLYQNWQQMEQESAKVANHHQEVKGKLFALAEANDFSICRNCGTVVTKADMNHVH